MKRYSMIQELFQLRRTFGLFAAQFCIGVCLLSLARAQCLTAPEGIVAWWPGENHAGDVIGTNDGMFLHTEGYGGGKVGQAFSLSSSNGIVVAPSASLNIGATSGLTLEAWITPSQLSAAWLMGWKNDVPVNGTPYGTHFKHSQPPGSGQGPGCLFANLIDTSGVAHHIGTAPVLASNVMQHVALTYDKSSGIARIFLDGVVVKQQYVGTFTPRTSFKFQLGGKSDPTEPGFSGLLDEPTVYARALTTNEIAAIYQAGTAGKCEPQLEPTCTPSPTGLVSWWRGEGNGLDSVGTNHGTLQGGGGFGSGYIGRAFALTSESATLRIPAEASLNVGIGTGFTIEAWINPFDTTSRSPVAEWNDGAGNWGVHLWVAPDAPGQLYANIVDSGGGWHQFSTGPGIILSNQFQHVALTYDKNSGGAMLFRNGHVVAHSTFSTFTPLTSYDLYLGWRASGAPGDTGTFIGLLDEVSLYNRALTTNELAAIYEAGAQGKCFTNQSPLAVADAFTTPTNLPVAFSAAKLILNDIDPDGDPLSIVAVSPNSVQGGTVVLNSGMVTYTPPASFAGSDSFTYTVSDGKGGGATGDVIVTVGNGGAIGLNIVFGPMMIGDHFVVSFAGIPGLTYTIEASGHVNGPWTKVANMTAPAVNTGFGVGVFQFSEPVGGNLTQFYRTVYPAY